MSDINRMLDDLLDTQPHRTDLRENIVREFESLSAQLADERKHADRLAEVLTKTLSAVMTSYDQGSNSSGHPEAWR